MTEIDLYRAYNLRHMTLGEQSTLVVAVTVLLYIAIPILLLIKGWPLRAGLAMAAIAFLPLIWQVKFTDSDAKGFGILLIVMIPLPLLLIAGGLVAELVRWTRIISKRRASSGAK